MYVILTDDISYHIKMTKVFKASFLYIGTVIGAGFASGREIALFFGNCSPINVALSSIFMSLLCAFFLLGGKHDLIPKNKLTNLVIFVCSLISTCTMIAGGDFMLTTLTNIPVFLGLIMALFSGIIVVFGIEKIKIASTILVPMIVISIALIFSKIPHGYEQSTFNVSKPILYSCLDILIGGVVISKEGKRLNNKQIAGVTLITCVFMGIMLYMLQSIVLQDTNGSLMPVFAISNKVGLKVACGILIVSAIFTTLVSALKTASDCLSQMFDNTRLLHKFSSANFKPFPTFFILTITYPISFVGFDNLVDYCYPALSFTGIIFSLIVAVKFLIKFVQNLRIKRAKSHIFSQ